MKGEGLATLCSRFLPASEDTRPFFILQHHPTPHFLCVSGNDSGIAGVWRDLGSGSSPHPPTQTRTPTISPELTLGPELRLCLPTLPFPQKSGHRGWHVDTQRPGRLGQGCPQDLGSRSPSCLGLVPCGQDPAPSPALTVLGHCPGVASVKYTLTPLWPPPWENTPNQGVLTAGGGDEEMGTFQGD